MLHKTLLALFFFVLISWPFNLMAQSFSKAPDPRQLAKPAENIMLGKWQEVKRTRLQKNKYTQTDFTDSMKIEIFGDSTMYIRLENGGYISEIYSFDKKGLHFGKKYSFPFYEMNKQIMVLGDGEFKHTLEPIDKFYIPRFKKVVPGAEKGKVAIESDKMKGIWQTYKKLDPNFRHVDLHLKRLEIKEAYDDGTFLVEFARSSIKKYEKDDAIMSIEKDVMFIKTKKGESFTYEIHKSDEGEMILYAGSTTYFLRDFSK